MRARGGVLPAPLCMALSLRASVCGAARYLLIRMLLARRVGAAVPMSWAQPRQTWSGTPINTADFGVQECVCTCVARLQTGLHCTAREPCCLGAATTLNGCTWRQLLSARRRPHRLFIHVPCVLVQAPGSDPPRAAAAAAVSVTERAIYTSGVTSTGSVVAQHWCSRPARQRGAAHSPRCACSQQRHTLKQQRHKLPCALVHAEMRESQVRGPHAPPPTQRTGCT